MGIPSLDGGTESVYPNPKNRGIQRMHFPDKTFLRLVADICEALPDRLEYRDSEMLAAGCRELADENDDVAIETVGKSAEGRPIELLRIGSGPIPLLFIGAPHPGEVVGTLTTRITGCHKTA